MAVKGTNTAAKQRLIQEIGALVVIVALLVGFFVYNHVSSSKSVKPVVSKPIDTSFDTNALDKVQLKDKTDPDVTPSQSELGKSDPFAVN